MVCYVFLKLGLRYTNKSKTTNGQGRALPLAPLPFQLHNSYDQWWQHANHSSNPGSVKQNLRNNCGSSHVVISTETLVAFYSRQNAAVNISVLNKRSLWQLKFSLAHMKIMLDSSSFPILSRNQVITWSLFRRTAQTAMIWKMASVKLALVLIWSKVDGYQIHHKILIISCMSF